MNSSFFQGFGLRIKRRVLKAVTIKVYNLCKHSLEISQLDLQVRAFDFVVVENREAQC